MLIVVKYNIISTNINNTNTYKIPLILEMRDYLSKFVESHMI